MSLKRKRAGCYAVAVGREVGVFATWEEAQRHVTGFPGALFKKFPDEDSAREYVAANSARQPPSPEDGTPAKARRSGGGPAAASADQRLEIDPRGGLTADQRAVYERVVVDGENVFFSGKAGTGKSFLLREMYHALRRRRRNVVVVAPTGIAAVNLGTFASTIHRFAGLKPGEYDVAKQIAIVSGWEDRRVAWRECDVLILDEVSMVDGAMFDLLHDIANSVRRGGDAVGEPVGRYSGVFGGLQVVACGDLHQLPPIQREAGMCYEAKNWTACFSLRNHMVLDSVQRQRDPGFVALLNAVRVGDRSPAVVTELCALSRPLPEDGIVPTLLYARNAEADQLNRRRLAELPAPLHVFTARERADNDALRARLREQCPAELTVQLKEGAQVMLCANLSVPDGLCNGSRGVVRGIVAAPVPAVEVEFASAGLRTIIPYEWSLTERERAPGVPREERRMLSASLCQVPLKLCWAMTMHKSQGLTLDRVEVHARYVFAPGQLYVALSRARCKEGLRLLGASARHIRVNESVLAFEAACGLRSFADCAAAALEQQPHLHSEPGPGPEAPVRGDPWGMLRSAAAAAHLAAAREHEAAARAHAAAATVLCDQRLLLEGASMIERVGDGAWAAAARASRLSSAARPAELEAVAAASSAGPPLASQLDILAMDACEGEVGGPAGAQEGEWEAPEELTPAEEFIPLTQE